MTDNPQWFRWHSTQIESEELKWVAAVGVRGVRSLTLPLDFGKGVENEVARRYNVNLYFAVPHGLALGANVFNVTTQGRDAINELDNIKES